MPNIIYAYIDDNGTRGSRVALNNDNNTWDFSPDGHARTAKEWFNRNKKDIAIGIGSSLVASLIIYIVLKEKGMINRVINGKLIK